MRDITSKEKILKKIRKSLINKTPNPFPGVDVEGLLFEKPQDSLEFIFAQNLISANGHFVYCENELDFMEHCIGLASDFGWKNSLCLEAKIQQLFESCEYPYNKGISQNMSHQVVFTSCEFLIARTGSVLISSALSGRRASAFAPIHVVIAYTSQLVFDIKDALLKIKNKYGVKLPSSLSIITGPSATADIENKIIKGAHGPAEIYVFLIDDLHNQNG